MVSSGLLTQFPDSTFIPLIDARFYGKWADWHLQDAVVDFSVTIDHEQMVCTQGAHRDLVEVGIASVSDY